MTRSDALTGKSLRGRAAAAGLSKAHVVDAAVRHIDEKGLAAFSLRDLARSLGVSPAVIYWHVGGGKEDLFAEVSASITGALADGLDPDMGWKQRLRVIFLRYRTLVHVHPNVAPLLGAQMKSNGVANLGWVETVLEALHEAGFHGEAARDAFNVLIGGLAGFITMELAPAPADKGSAWEDLFRQRMDAIAPQSHPHTHAALPIIANRIFVLRWQNGADISYDTSFALLLDLVLDGLETRARSLQPMTERTNLS